MSSVYKKLTKEQAEEMKKPIDHQELCKAIRQKHGKTMLYVRDKYQGDSKPLFVDKGGSA